MPQRGNLFVENAYIDFGFLPQRGNLRTLQIITRESGCSAGARIIFSLNYLQTGYASGVKNAFPPWCQFSAAVGIVTNSMGFSLRNAGVRVSTNLIIPVRGDTHRGDLFYQFITDTNQGGDCLCLQTKRGCIIATSFDLNSFRVTAQQ